MRCRQFLHLYSDYRDGLIGDHQVVRRLHRHLGSCEACARYDASVRAGVEMLRRAADEMEPSPDFRDRLQRRIAAGAEPVPVTPAAAGLAALLMLAAALALVIHEGTGRSVRPPRPTRTLAAQHERPMVVVNPGLPFVTFTDLSVPAFHRAPTSHSPDDLPLDTWANLPR